jgi:hypothetical protein
VIAGLTLRETPFRPAASHDDREAASQSDHRRTATASHVNGSAFGVTRSSKPTGEVSLDCEKFCALKFDLASACLGAVRRRPAAVSRTVQACQERDAVAAPACGSKTPPSHSRKPEDPATFADDATPTRNRDDCRSSRNLV